MWFKQIQVFQLTRSLSFSPEELTAKLELLAFSPCLPSMPIGMGWVPIIDEEDAPLIRSINGYTMLCLQVEEKILPGGVIRQQLKEKIKEIEASMHRKLRQTEKLSLKDEVTMTLLPRAFSKLTRVYAYIDNKTNQLILGTASAKLTEHFMAMFKKTITEDIHPLEVQKLSPDMTGWLRDQTYPSTFAIEKACVLQDPSQSNRIIRCQQQDLFAAGIQDLVKDGCEVIQFALSWHDQVNFVLVEDFSIRSIKYQDVILAHAKEMEPETKLQQFDADFLIMTETLSGLLSELQSLFIKAEDTAEKTANAPRLAAVPELEAA